MNDPNDALSPAAEQTEEPDIELDEAQEDRQFAEELAQEAEPEWTPDWWCTDHGDAGNADEECRYCAEERAFWRSPEEPQRAPEPSVEALEADADQAITEATREPDYPPQVPEWEPYKYPEMARQVRELVERCAEAPEYIREQTLGWTL